MTEILKSGRYRFRTSRPPIDRFQGKYAVDEETGCWLWTAAIGPSGYADFETKFGRTAHRFSYSYYVGQIPDGLVIDHLCRVRHCVNPAHLEPVTVGENIRRGMTGKTNRTHCPHGHLFDEANTKLVNGWRACWTCVRQRDRARSSEKRKRLREQSLLKQLEAQL